MIKTFLNPESQSHQWFKSYGHFTEGVNFAYWWSFIGGGSAINGATPSSFQPFMTIFLQTTNIFHKQRPWSSCGINCSNSARQINVLYSTEINFDHLVHQPYLFLIQSFILCENIFKTMSLQQTCKKMGSWKQCSNRIPPSSSWPGCPN